MDQSGAEAKCEWPAALIRSRFGLVANHDSMRVKQGSKGAARYDDRGDIAWTDRPGGFGAARRYGESGRRPARPISNWGGPGGRRRFGRRPFFGRAPGRAVVSMWTGGARPGVCEGVDRHK